MPECYEVLRMAQYLTDNGLKNSTINNFTFCNKGERMLKHLTQIEFIDQIKNQTIITIKTKAKFTFLQLSNDVIEWHYRFTGIPHLDTATYDKRLYSIYSLPITPTQPQKSTRFILTTNQGHCLRYIDTRCLSTLTLYRSTTIEKTKRYQTIPADINQTQTLCLSQLKRFPTKRLKTFLQDQHTIPSGIGNYLACEICAYAKIAPFRQLHTLTTANITALNQALAQVHYHATTSAQYKWFLVFNQSHCQCCQKPIKKSKFTANEQTTHWCMHCQL